MPPRVQDVRVRPQNRPLRVLLQRESGRQPCMASMPATGPALARLLELRGGESLLAPEAAFGAVRHMRSRWTNGTVHAWMVTNGTLVTNEIARELTEAKISVALSMDGPRHVHDRLRLTKDRRPTSDSRSLPIPRAFRGDRRSRRWARLSHISDLAETPRQKSRLKMTSRRCSMHQSFHNQWLTAHITAGLDLACGMHFLGGVWCLNSSDEEVMRRMS